MAMVLGLHSDIHAAAARPQVSHPSQSLFPANRTIRCRISRRATFIVSRTDDDDYSPFLNATRTDPPRTYTTIAKEYRPGEPDDTMVFRFDNVPIHPEDLSIAMAAALYVACNWLSERSGRESEEIPGGEFALSDYWYNFEVGSDLWSEQGLQLSHLKTIIDVVSSLGQKFNMRQFTFEYHSAGRFLAVGHLKNGRIPMPPRQHAQLGQRHTVAHGVVIYGGYGQPVDFEGAARGLQAIFQSGWGLMTRIGKHSYEICNPHHTYVLETHSPRLRFEATVPVSRLTLRDILD
ncbi:MAG: hypothetical protein Q9191_004852, partial [Dirinaria sp. TL-2023a]